MKVQTIPTLKTNILWNSVGSFIYLFCQWLTTIIVVRVTGYEDAGALSLAMSATTVFYCISLFGLRNFQVSDLNCEYSDRSYIVSRYVTCAGALLLCIIFLLFVSYATKQVAVISLYMLFKFSEAFADVYHGIDQKAGRMDIIGKSFVMRGIIMLVLFTSIQWFTKDLVLAILGMGVGTLIFVLCYDRPKAYLYQTDSATNTREIFRLLRKGLPLVGYLVVNNAIPSLPKMFLDNIYGSKMLGVYSSIATPALIIQVAASFVFTPLITPFASAFSGKDKRSFYGLLHRCLGAILLIVIAGLIGSLLVGDWGLALLFGEGILAYSSLLIPIVLCAILTAVVWFIGMLLTVQRSYTGLIVGSTLGLITCFVLSPILLSFMGLNGASVALIISLGVQIVISIVFFHIKNKNNFTLV